MEFQRNLKFEEINKEKFPDYLHSYYDIKSNYKNYIILYQVGSFFETYFEDARIVSKVTGFALTKRKFTSAGEIPMAGIPSGSLTSAVQKLLKNNNKAVLVTQTDEKDDKNKAVRKVTRIYTKGTVFETCYLNSKENNYLASIFKKGSLTEIAYADISTGEVFSSEGTLDEIECELARIHPIELIVPKDKKIPEYIYIPYKFELLDEKFYQKENSDTQSSALFALFSYTNYILDKFAPVFEKVKHYDIKKLLFINYLTRKNLELVKNSYSGEEYGSLYHVLDRCKTAMGKRLLSSFITSPLCDIKEIQKRQNTLNLLVSNKELKKELGILLENTGDILRLSSKISNKQATPIEFLTTKEALKNLGTIDKIGKELKISAFYGFSYNKNLLEDFYEILSKTFEEDIDKVKEGDYIKEGANIELDGLTFEYGQYEKQLKDYEKRLKEYSGTETLKINCRQGTYYIELPLSSEIPKGADFRLVQKTKTYQRYTTDELINLEEKITSLQTKITSLREKIFLDLKSYTKELTGDIRGYSKKIAMLDFLHSAAEVIEENSYTCPVFDDEFDVKSIKHPVLNEILKETEPLDFKITKQEPVILTGKNGIGKSTLLKELGIAVIMAQAGLFVPCGYARLPLFEKLFGVLNVSDEIINKKSSHCALMKEISYIARNHKGKSLVLLDEAGKNTSYKEGLSISYGIIKYFMKNPENYTVFSTHYNKLSNLLNASGDKVSCCRITRKSGFRTVEKGTEEESGGIASAAEENLPEEIISFANEAFNILRD